MTTILGISAFYHDSAAVLIKDGRIIAAAQEERFSRKKHDASYPQNAIDYVLKEGTLTIDEIDHIAFYDKPFLKFERLLETYIAFAPKGFTSFRRAFPLWIREKLFQKDYLLKKLRGKTALAPDKLLFAEHHVSHAASAFYPSPYKEAVVLTLDGVGEWATTTIAIGKGNNLRIQKEIHFPHSLGLLYSAFTYYTGFKVNSGEYKLMGLAPYGEPRFKDLILDKLIDLKDDGSFHLEMSYFNYCTGLTMVNQKFCDLFGKKIRCPESEELTQFHMDIAASIQAVLEHIVLHITRASAAEYNIKNLCMAGGVALNCVANGKILRDGAFENIWVQPAAGDAGGAVGAALAAWHNELGQPRHLTAGDAMQGSYLGPRFDQDTIENELKEAGAIYEVLSEESMLEEAAKALSESRAIGWFQGRMEFGPRALGNRSILGDPRCEKTQKTLNLKVKYRESFRPFAPSVLREHVANWFDLDSDSPYMLLVADVKKDKIIAMRPEEKKLFGIEKLNIKRSEIPAVTHVDYSARVQTVHKDTNPLYHRLISQFYALTHCPVIVNTSFNVRGEPIVCTPTDAFKCFMGTELDMLICGTIIMHKSKQNPQLKRNYKEQFEAD